MLSWSTAIRRGRDVQYVIDSMWSLALQALAAAAASASANKNSEEQQRNQQILKAQHMLQQQQAKGFYPQLVSIPQDSDSSLQQSMQAAVLPQASPQSQPAPDAPPNALLPNATLPQVSTTAQFRSNPQATIHIGDQEPALQLRLHQVDCSQEQEPGSSVGPCMECQSQPSMFEPHLGFAVSPSKSDSKRRSPFALHFLASR